MPSVVIKYLGSKRKLLPRIARLLDGLPPLARAADLFTGTTRVARLLKARGVFVHANDTASYSEVLARASIGTDAREIDRTRLQRLLDDLDATPPAPGYFARTFGENSRYVHPDNGARIDAIRARIDSELPDEPWRSLALASLLVAADRVDSTTGLQMAYLKAWAPRALRPLRLQAPELLDGPGAVTRLDAAACAARLPPVDLAYIDPPYNQHSYFRNYHVWETLVRNDAPPTYGVACKRIDARERRSPWNSPRTVRAALDALLSSVDARILLVSASDEGFVPLDELHERLALRGEVARHEAAHERYIGARIGIHNPAGLRVGTVGRVRNRECLFVVRTR